MLLFPTRDCLLHTDVVTMMGTFALRSRASLISVPLAVPLTLVTKLRTTSAMVDEPITDLCHADAGCLPDVSRHLFEITVEFHTLENMAFCSSVGYGFAMFCRRLLPTRQT